MLRPLCILSYWPEDDPLRSKHVANITFNLCVDEILFLLFLYLTQRDDKSKIFNVHSFRGEEGGGCWDKADET